MSIPEVKAKLLEGKRGLIVGIANDQSIAWGCARAFRGFGAELAITYLNDKARRFVEPLANELEAPIFMPLDVSVQGQMEAVFERIGKDWGKLDFVVHSIAFSPRDTLVGRVTDAPLDGFLKTMQISCWSFIRMAQLAEPLMKDGGTLFTMTTTARSAWWRTTTSWASPRQRSKAPSATWRQSSGRRAFGSTRFRRGRWRHAPLRASRNSVNCWTRLSARRRRRASSPSTTSALRLPSWPMTRHG